ncbi:transposase [Streptomyces tendae]|uniref:transposase n=1 Tax=Streptomyces tendae TaxID=1932 RepID=UPI0033D57AE9
MPTWLEVTWPAIRATAKAGNGEVLCADRVGIRSAQVTGRTWGEKGRTLIVRRTGNRFSVNAMSAISTKGRMHFVVFTDLRRESDVPLPRPAHRPLRPQDPLRGGGSLRTPLSHIVRGYFGGPHLRYTLEENPLSF